MKDKKTEATQIPEVPKGKNIDAGKKRLNRTAVKVIAANVVNFILLGIIFYMISTLPQVAERLKGLRSAQIAAEETADAAILTADIERNAQQISALRALRVKDSEFIDFVEAASAMQAEGVISEVIYPGGAVMHPDISALKGRGFPIVFVVQGSQENISSAMARIFGLPFLFLPQDIEIETVANGDGSQSMTARLSVLLIVDDNFAAN